MASAGEGITRNSEVATVAIRNPVAAVREDRKRNKGIRNVSA